MTCIQFCEAADLSQAELACWLNAGLVVTDPTGGAGRNQEFADDQLARVRALQALHRKGVRLSRLARVNLDLEGRFVIFDDNGEWLRTCRDAEAAIRAVVAGKRWCSAVEIPRANGF